MIIPGKKKKLQHNFLAIGTIILIMNWLVVPTDQVVYGFSTPQPISPLIGTVTTSDNYPPLGIPTVVWETVPDAIEYTVQFSRDIEFSTVLLEVVTPNNRYTPTIINSELFSDGDWYWRVRVTSPIASPYSAPMWFIKQWAADINKPILISPEPDAILTFFNAPNFSWHPVVGASAYIFDIATSPDGFNSPIYSSKTLATTYQPLQKLVNGQYFWRITPLDAASHLGIESEVRSFRLMYGTTTLEQTPHLYKPEENEIVQLTVSFQWEAIPGAEKYLLEYMADDGMCLYGSGTIIETSLTSYTPEQSLSSGKYCWHVKVISGLSEGEWSETRHFGKQWNIQPVLLTPTDNYRYGNYPLFSWSPVPGAAYYKIQINYADQNDVFDQGLTSNPFYSSGRNYGTIPNIYTWQVIPFDWNDNAGAASVTSSYQSYYTSTAPSLIYPLYYYPPNDPTIYGEDIILNPYEDRTAQYPIFHWHRVDNPWPYGGNYASAYRLQVSTSRFFSPVIWSVDTESTHAAPTMLNPFPEINPDQNYYWRVCPLDAPLESSTRTCLTILDTEDPWWSQTWRARFDPELGLDPTTGAAPVLLRPTHGDEWVEATPLLEWQALEGSAYYQIQVSRDPLFPDSTETVINSLVPYPVYSSETSLAQRSLERLNFGTYYWRVRANVSSNWSDWSETERFQIASQSEWRYDRTVGSLENRLQIGSDVNGDAISGYDLTTLYASSSDNKWFFGFNLSLTPGLSMVYGLYLDTDHVDGSGADIPPPDRNYAISTIPAHQPEYAIYVEQINGNVDEENVFVYTFSNNTWQEPKRLSELSIPGEPVFYFEGNYLEFQVPDNAIGMDDDTGSISVILFSAPLSTGAQLQDTVPDDPEVPGSGILSRFTSVSEGMNLRYPISTSNGNDLAVYHSMMPFLWDYPSGGDPTGDDEDPPSPWAGFHLQVCLDIACTSIIEEIYQDSSPYYFASHHQTIPNDLRGDGTYYWRIRPRYKHLDLGYYGVFNNGDNFVHRGFVPHNLQISYTFATPTFTWDLVEGAGAFDLQISNHPDFGDANLVLDIENLTQNQYTPTQTLEESEYWWRVRVRRYGNTISDWSTPSNFVLDLPSPTGLSPNDPIGTLPVAYAPTMCWDHLIAYANGYPVLTAWRYTVEVSTDPGFGTVFDSVETEQNCWTPTHGYDDGKYYWRVAMIDGDNRRAGFSDAAQFTKQYPLTTLLSPIGTIGEVPTFMWMAVPGASSYLLHVSQSPNFTPIYENIQTVNVQFTPTHSYEYDKTYYWRVAMQDMDGKVGAYINSITILGNSISRLPIIFK